MCLGLDAVVAQALGMPTVSKVQDKTSKLGEDYAGSKKKFNDSDDEHEKNDEVQETEEERERKRREEKKAKKVQRQKRRKAEKRALKAPGEGTVAQSAEACTEANVLPQTTGESATRQDNKRKRKIDAVAATEGKQGNAVGVMARERAWLAPTRLWGFYDDDWRKCVLLKVKKDGRHKVEWPDGSTSVLRPSCIQPRVKKKTRSS
jgi:hypothetical protein